jgi:hypothetical protein
LQRRPFFIFRPTCAGSSLADNHLRLSGYVSQHREAIHRRGATAGAGTVTVRVVSLTWERPTPHLRRPPPGRTREPILRPTVDQVASRRRILQIGGRSTNFPLTFPVATAGPSPHRLRKGSRRLGPHPLPTLIPWRLIGGLSGASSRFGGTWPGC